MRTVRLGDVAQVISGGTPKTAVAEYWGGNVFWATPADLSILDGAYISATSRTLTTAGVQNCAAVMLPVGSVLLSSRAPIGHVAITAVPMATNQGFKSLVPGPQVDAKFLYYWFRSKTALLTSLGNGATFKELSKRTVQQIEIPLPPVTEQRRIARILDCAERVRTSYVRVLGELEDLTRGVFYEMFGSPLTNRLGLPRVKVGDVANVMTGNSPSRAESANFGNAIEWIKSDNLGGEFVSQSAEGLSERGRTQARIAPARSVLVTCIAGSRASIGKASMSDRPVAFNQQINAVLPSPMLDSTFLLCQLKVAPDLVREKSTGGMKGMVSKSAFRAIEILFPPLDMQQEFAARAKSVSRQRQAVLHALKFHDELFASLQSRAFRGEL